MLGKGVYLSTDIEKARCYRKGMGGIILKCRVWVGKVKKIDTQNHPMQRTWHARGYDSAWVPPKNRMVGSGRTETCVWDPSRIEVIGRAS